MSYNEELAERIRAYFHGRDDVEEKSMFGGLAFMVDGHMCVGAIGDRLMARIGPTIYENALKDMHVSIMDFTGKPLKGYVYIECEGIEDAERLNKWIRQCEYFITTLPPKKSVLPKVNGF